jgi:ABC-type branched-subunit amino acid transport system substrate-binding protein
MKTSLNSHFLKIFFLLTFALCFSGATSTAGISKDEPSINSQKPTFVILYTERPSDRNEEYENLRDVAQFAFDFHKEESKSKMEPNIVAIDDRADPQYAEQALKKQFAKERPAAIIGPLYSNVAIGLKDFINENKVPMISIFATHNDLTKNSSYITRICASNRRLVKSMADYLVPEVEKHHLNITAFKDLSDGYSTDLADTFRLSTDSIKTSYNEILFRGLGGLEHLKDLNSKIWNPTKKDILFMPVQDIVSGKIIASLESEPYMVAAIDTVNFLHLMTKLKNQKSHIRLITTSQWLPQKSEFSKKIEAAFLKRFKHAMTITSALTFDAAYAVAKAYDRAFAKGLPLNFALHDSTKFSGVTGLILIGADGERLFSDQFLKEEFIE